MWRFSRHVWIDIRHASLFRNVIISLEEITSKKQPTFLLLNPSTSYIEIDNASNSGNHFERALHTSAWIHHHLEFTKTKSKSTSSCSSSLSLPKQEYFMQSHLEMRIQSPLNYYTLAGRQMHPAEKRTICTL